MQQLDIGHIRESLALLQKRRPSVFGADEHGFRLNSTVSEPEVLAFESTHRVSLPLDYRQFLTSLGNGGAGPFYGIFPLGKMDDNFSLHSWRERDGIIGDLSEPFPFATEWNNISPMPKDDLGLRDQAEYDRQMGAFDSTYWDSSLVNGAIPICHEGCALRVWLVITGNQAGHVWEDGRSEYTGLKPLRLNDGSVATFSGWYVEWLESCLAAT
jgi:SMI1/KNR4 family protein SUKH-1